MNSTLRSLTSEQVGFFWSNGWLVVEDLLSPDDVARLGRRADQIARGETGADPERVQAEKAVREGEAQAAARELEVRKLYWLAGQDQVLQNHARHPAIVDVIADLIQTDDIKLYADQLFMKPPAIGAAQPWHQDSKSFIDIYPMDLVTAWAAIDDSTLENGCLEFVSGSHLWGLLSNEQMDEHRSRIGSDPAYMPDPAPLRSGSVSFHHSLTWHASRANTSTARRRGYAVHYMRAESRRTTALEGPRVPPPLQIRGRSFEGCV
jgi:phytanoyl-CoA hydroxylase